MTAITAKPEYTPSSLVYLAAIVFLILLGNLALIFSGVSSVVEGGLPGPDSYMRLLRVTQLYETGAWFDHTIPRSNAPYGEVLHWTRPADLLQLAGALLLEPFVGFERGLYLWGISTGPLLHAAMVMVLLWAVTPILDHWHRFLLILALFTQMAIWPQGLLGRTDHHMLIMLVFAASLGGAIRILVRPAQARVALLAGAAAGFGLWLSVEFLMGWAILFGALTVSWIRRGGTQAHLNMWHALGMAAVIALALVVERPPPAWFAEEYDRVSLVHLFVALVAAGFWGVVTWFMEATRTDQTPLGRSCISGLGAIGAGALLFLAFPKFFGGPEVDYHPELRHIFLDHVSETRPMLPVNLRDTGWLLLFLGQAVIAVPYILVRLWQRRRDEDWYAWQLIGFGLLLYFPLAVYMRRFSGFASILAAIVMAELLGRLLARDRTKELGVKRILIFGLGVPGILFGGLAIGGVLVKNNPFPLENMGTCAIGPLLTELNRPDGLGQKPLTVLASVNFGPRLMYHTRHRVVTTPYPRNARGQLDAVQIYAAEDFEQARLLIDQRRIDVITACIKRPTYWQTSDRPNSFDSRLRRGELPDWLSPVEVGDEAREEIGIFRVERSRS